MYAFYYPGGDADSIPWLQETINGVIADRCATKGNRRVSVVDIVPAVSALSGWTV